MSGIFKTPSDGYIAVPLLNGEQIIRQQSASFLVHGKPAWGGLLVLTNQRLLFRPIKVGAATDILRQGIKVLPGNLVLLGQIVNKVLDYSTAYGDSLVGAVEAPNITGVTPGRNAALLHPPTLTLTLNTGQTLEIGILAHIFSPSPLPSNNIARDQMVDDVSQMLYAL